MFSGSTSSYSSHSSLAIPQKRSATSDLSDGSPGGKRRELRNPSDEIVLETQRFLGFLNDYLKLFVAPSTTSATSQLRGASFLYSSLLRIGDNPTNTDIGKFACTDVSRIVDMVSHCLPNEFQTFAHLAAVRGPGFVNNPERLMRYLDSSRKRIVELGSEIAGAHFKLSPSEFGKRGAWHDMQDSKSAILCHRPIYNRPHLPLKLVHEAFYEFMKDAEFLNHSNRMDFHSIAADLATQLAAPLESEAERITNVLNVLKKVFPDESPFRWSQEKCFDTGGVNIIYQRILSDDCLGRFSAQGKKPSGTNLMIVKIKLEEGEGGDAFMQVCCTYDRIIGENIRYRETGAPTFLITMSGPNIKICGGWADNSSTGPSVDVFKVHFACLDVTHRNELAKSLYSLSKAIKRLPSCHVPASGCIAAGVPSIFTSYRAIGGTENFEFPLKLLNRLEGDLGHSVFAAHSKALPHTQEDELNCVAKLVFDHYGLDVHQTLAPELAPGLFGWSSKPGIDHHVYIMEYLPKPSIKSKGWMRLDNLPVGLVIASGVLDEISDILKESIKRLQALNFVHGDLRPNNLMIKMANCYVIEKPVSIKVIDFEWADTLGRACYPQDRNENAGYPGEAGAQIGLDDDTFMVEKWAREQLEVWNFPERK